MVKNAHTLSVNRTAVIKPSTGWIECDYKIQYEYIQLVRTKNGNFNKFSQSLFINKQSAFITAFKRTHTSKAIYVSGNIPQPNNVYLMSIYMYFLYDTIQYDTLFALKNW